MWLKKCVRRATRKNKSKNCSVMIIMTETVVEYAKLSEEEQQRLRNFYEEIRKHDEATSLGSARREGKSEGMLETLVGLVKKGLLTVAQAAEEAHMTVPEFEDKTGLKV